MKLKISLGKIILLISGYVVGLSIFLAMMYQLNNQHLDNPFLKDLNFGLFTGSYWGAVYALLRD